MNRTAYDVTGFMVVALINLVCNARNVCADFATDLLAYRFDAPEDVIDCAIDRACRMGWIERRGSFLFATPEARMASQQRRY